VKLIKYAYQGQEHDEETGLEAFELRLWDGRIGRWLSTDPYGQYHSPYMGMGNNPVIGIDPNGGFDSKFGAWWYTIFNGGGSIVPDGNGGFDVSQSYYETIGGYDYLGLRMISNRPSSSFNYSIFKGVPVIETPFEGPWGVTLPPYFIATSNNPTQDLLSHEVGHWLEYLDVGTEDFYINYGIPSALNQIENKLFKGTSIPFIVHTRYFTEIDANQRARLNFGYEFDNPDRFPLKNDYTVNQRREINKYSRIQKFSIYFILYHGN